MSTNPVYDPKKRYTWEQEEKFEFNGTEFGMTYNTIMKRKGELMMELELLTMLEVKLKSAVEAGKAVEYLPESEQK